MRVANIITVAQVTRVRCRTSHVVGTYRFSDYIIYAVLFILILHFFDDFSQ